MTNLLEIYKCDICGNMVEMVHAGGGQLVCCGQPMRLCGENTTDAAVEKHIPVIEKHDDSVRITVGSVAHPMTAEHYIEWIELLMNGRLLRQKLEPDDEPVAIFDGLDMDEAEIAARAYCNLHGLWKSEA